jgi:hypothetical protein
MGEHALKSLVVEKSTATHLWIAALFRVASFCFVVEAVD